MAMRAVMHEFPSRFRRLDEILGDLPIDEPMLLSELDGYLSGIAVCPAAIPPEEWLPPIWGGVDGETAPFEDPIDAQLFADMVTARHAGILRELARGKPKPIFDVDGCHGEVMWDGWVDGFAMATQLRPESWSVEDEGGVRCLAHLRLLAEIANERSSLTSIEINALAYDAPAAIGLSVKTLYDYRARMTGTSPGAAMPVAKVGRNDPCACGSGKKSKRCCGG